MKNIYAKMRAVIGVVMISFLAAHGHANAQTIIDVGPGLNPEIPISTNEKNLTRLAVFNGGIDQLKFARGAISVSPEPSNRSAFLIANQPGSIPAFIMTASGQTHQVTFIAGPTIKAGNIVLREPNLTAQSEQVADPNAPRLIPDAIGRASSHDAAITRLVKAMARNEAPSDIRFERVEREFSLWEGSRFWLMSRFTGHTYSGDHYRIQNTSTEPLRLDEREFYKPGVLAVAMEVQQLRPGESTNIYVIRSNDGKKQ